MQNRGFVEGYMPMQMLAEMALIVGLLVLVSYLLEKRYRITINKLFQAVGLLSVAVLYLKYRVTMPFSTLAIYTTTIAIGIFVWVSSTEASWKSFRDPILAVMDGSTRATRVIRALAVITLPLLIGILGFNIMWGPVDAYNAPITNFLRIYHSAPPPSITVYPPEHFVKDRSEK